jgi:uncharacterized glyoxalase superfamily protein PhnB
MSNNRSRSVMPIITVDSVDAEHDFYTEKLGFTRLMGVVGKDGRFDFVTVVLGDARIMFARPKDERESTGPAPGKRAVEIYLEVADVEAYLRELTARGVRISEPLTMQWWGDQTFKVIDPYGYQVWFYQSVAEPRPPQGVKIV